MFELSPERFDQVQLRTVRREEEEPDPRRVEGIGAILDQLGVVDGVVVHHDDTRTRATVVIGKVLWQSGDLALHKLQVGGGVVLALIRATRCEDQAWATGIEGRPGAHHVDPPSCGRLERDEFPFTDSPPAVPGGQRGRESTLVEVEQVDRALTRLVFLIPPIPVRRSGRAVDLSVCGRPMVWSASNESAADAAGDPSAPDRPAHAARRPAIPRAAAPSRSGPPRRYAAPGLVSRPASPGADGPDEAAGSGHRTHRRDRPSRSGARSVRAPAQAARGTERTSQLRPTAP